MYQSQIAGLKQDIIKNGGFEACQITGKANGISIKGVRKLPDSINLGRHHIFIDLEEYRGSGFYCKLNNKNSYTFSKPVNEVGCHIDFYGSENVLEIKKANSFESSQIVTGLTFSHTQYGHSSYYVYAERVTTSIPDLPTTLVDNEALKTIERIEELLEHLKGLV